MKPYYEEDGITIYHRDCRDILPTLDKVDLVLTDPPYGIKRFQKGSLRFDKKGEYPDGIKWDVAPSEKFLIEVVEKGKESIIWGYNNLRLPCSEHFLIWDKMQTVDNFASAELAFSNTKKPAKIFRYAIHRHNHDKAGGHPTEKPLKLFEWCIGQANNPITILDPYLGIGTTLVAAKNLGRKAIGIELEEKYCEIAVNRLRQGVLPL